MSNHHVDAHTIGRELHGSIKPALGFLIEAAYFAQLNNIAAANGLSTGYLLTAAENLTTQADDILAALPHVQGLIAAVNAALIEDINRGGVDQNTATQVIAALNGALKLPQGALFEFASGSTFLNAGATGKAVHLDARIRHQLNVNWNQALNAARQFSVSADFQAHRAAGFSPASAVGVVTNDIITLAQHL